jgi:prepilin-type N-terminal cleavage/methylation domain-containing protein
MQRITREHGFSMPELLVSTGILLVLMSVSLPTVVNAAKTYKLSGSARSIASQLALARMRAAAEFTQAQLNANTSAGSYEIDLCTTKNTATGGCTTFTQDPNSGTQYLAAGITFGYGSITTPAGAQATIGQTTPIVFNSRGIPIDSNLNPTGNDALYLTNSAGQYYAVTVYASGKVTVWQYTGSAWREM